MFSVRFRRRVGVRARRRHRHRRNDFCFSRQNCLSYTLDIWYKEGMGLGICTRWPVGEHGYGIAKQKFACLQGLVRTTHPIITKLCSYISLAMLITWIDFGEIPLENLFLPNFLKNFRMFFSRSDTLLDISQEWMVRLIWNEKEVHQLDTGWTMWPWPLTSPMTLTFDFSMSSFKIAVSEELLSDWCETKRKQII